MATLIAAYNSEGCIGRCDARCYLAKDVDCDCICGGRNHGAGYQAAIDNTRRFADDWLARYKKQHPEATNFDLPVDQGDLFTPGE